MAEMIAVLSGQGECGQSEVTFLLASGKMEISLSNADLRLSLNGDLSGWLMFLHDFAGCCSDVATRKERTCKEVERLGQARVYRSRVDTPFVLANDRLMIRLWCQPRSYDGLPVVLEIQHVSAQLFDLRVTFEQFTEFCCQLCLLADAAESYYCEDLT